MTNDELVSLARDSVLREAQAVAAIADQINPNFLDVAHILLACSGHVLVAGSGNSHATALRMAHMFSCVGTPALFIHPGDAQHGTSGAVKPNDVVILISRGGETDEVNKLGHIAKQRGATVIAFTEKPESTVGLLSNAVLQVQSDPVADLAGTIATAGSLSMSAMGDALAVVLFRLRGYTLSEFGLTHPGGAVGKELHKSKS